MAKKIISFCLWGDSDIYNIGAVSNADAALKVYPDWKCRFYVLEGTPAAARLQQFRNVEVIFMPPSPGFSKMLWRFSPASEPDVDFAIFRDCDSRIGWRERGAVDRWIASGKAAHIMRDVETHAGMLMPAGMCGLRGGAVSDMGSLIENWIESSDSNLKQTDELFLKKMVWPRIQDNVLFHGVAYSGGFGPQPEPFPPHEPWRGEYVGMVIHPDDRDREIYYKDWRTFYQKGSLPWHSTEGESKWSIRKFLSWCWRQTFLRMMSWLKK